MVKDYEIYVYVRERFYYFGINFILQSEMKCILNIKDGEIFFFFLLLFDWSEFFRFKYMLYKNRFVDGD